MMNAHRHLAIILILTSSLSYGCSKSDGDVAEQGRATSAVVRPHETVFYAKNDLLSTSGAYKRLSQNAANSIRLPFAYLLQGLESLDLRASTDILVNADGVLPGAKDFGPPTGPTGLGDVQ